MSTQIYVWRRTRRAADRQGTPPQTPYTQGGHAIATITLTIPDAVLPRVKAALCAKAGLPESNANAKEAVIRWIKDTVQSVEYDDALRAASAAVVVSDVDGLVT